MWIKIVGLVLLVLVLAVAAAMWMGARNWDTATREVRARLDAQAVPPTTARFDPAELEGLPAPVRRFFGKALTPGQGIVTAVQLSHEGKFNSSDGEPKWVPFTSTQRVVTARAGFDWDARIRMAPGMTAHVRDAYVAGEGILVAKLFGLITVADEPRTIELALGEFMRFVAEAAWYPTVMLPSQGARWEAVDDRRARVTLRDGALAVTLTIGFGADDLIETVRADSRVRVSAGTREEMPWGGRFWGYERRDGMLVPREGEVAWLPRERAAMPYWRGRVTAVEYGFAR
jgi:hypothetical protein